MALSREQAIRLFHECETLENTGRLPSTAELRQETIMIYGKDTVLTMRHMAYKVYRFLAQGYMHEVVHEEGNSKDGQRKKTQE